MDELTDADQIVSIPPSGQNKVGNAYFLSCIVHLAFQDQDRKIEKAAHVVNFS
jgi:hypothetical protein